MILDEIIAHKRTEIVRLPPLDRSVLVDLPRCRGFRRALIRPPGEGIHVIAECKKGSPSRGILMADYDPVLIAYQYVLGGAHAISVLTDERFFFGHLTDLERVHAAVAIPVIRKDFVIDPRQIAQARLAGADAVLLIVACLEDGVLRDLQGFARDIGLDVLVEVHDEHEAARALRLEADLIGVNNRNLRDFSVSLETTFDLAPGLVGAGRVIVSESGIAHRDHCLRLEQAGIDAVLVGESLMTSEHPDARIRQLCGRILGSELGG